MASPSDTFQVLRIPANGSLFELVSLAKVWAGTIRTPAMVNHVPDLCQYWGVYGWDSRHNARFVITEHENPIMNGMYVVFWSKAVHIL